MESAGYGDITAFHRGLPATTPLSELVRLAKARWRIEHDTANS